MRAAESRLPRALYRADQVRDLDRIAIEDCGIAGFTLMQRAATFTFKALLDSWPQVRHLLVFVGSGNNGGDGYVLAGLAREHGLNPEIIQVGDPARLTGDAALARDFAHQRQVPMARFDRDVILGTGSYPADHTVSVDALLGTGLDRPVSDSYLDAIATINELPFPVLAVDIPSGLCSDTGNVLGAAVKARITVTFIGLKQGLLTGSGVDLTGRLLFHDLDVPDSVFNGDHSPRPGCHRIDMHEVSRYFTPRRRAAHKGQFGHTLVIGGDFGFGGAALMAARAALRVGSGLVSVITRSVNRSGFLAAQPEIMVVGTEDGHQAEQTMAGVLQRASVIVIGPGLGTGAWSMKLLDRAQQEHRERATPLVVDADGLNLLSGQAKADKPLGRSDNWVLTPHPGEAARLLGWETETITADRFTAVTSLQRQWGGSVLLKGAGSLLCLARSGTQVLELCTEGNPGMATGGMGDILSGLIGGLMAQGFSPADSLRIAVCVHGESADLAAAQQGERGLAATDLLPFVQRLVNPELPAC